MRLAFLLPKADRMFLIVRGPAPSCRVAGYIPVRGHKGANTVYFAGRVHGHRLAPGVYLISLSSTRSLVPGAATEYVRVISPRRSLPVADQARKPSCKAAAGAHLVRSTPQILLAEAVPKVPQKTRSARPTAQVAGVKLGSPTGKGSDERASGLLPKTDAIGAAADDASEQPFLAIAVLTIVVALLLTMVALVTRFLRGSWNP